MRSRLGGQITQLFRGAEADSDNSAEEPQSIRSSLMDMLQGALGSFTAVAFNGAQIVVVLVTVFFGVVFMLINPRPILGMMFAALPERHHGQALVIIQQISRFVPAWAGATLLGMVTIGFLVFLLMWPIFGFMDALVLRLTTAVTLHGPQEKHNDLKHSSLTFFLEENR